MARPWASVSAGSSSVQHRQSAAPTWGAVVAISTARLLPHVFDAVLASLYVTEPVEFIFSLSCGKFTGIPLLSSGLPLWEGSASPRFSRVPAPWSNRIKVRFWIWSQKWFFCFLAAPRVLCPPVLVPPHRAPITLGSGCCGLSAGFPGHDPNGSQHAAACGCLRLQRFTRRPGLCGDGAGHGV